MLELSGSAWSDGAAIPFGWHFALFGAETPKAMLRADGFPGLGVAFPHIDAKRLVAAGRKINPSRALHIGQAFTRTSRVSAIIPKTTPNGPVTIVKVEHTISDRQTNSVLLSEEQTYILLDQPYVEPRAAPTPPGGFQIIKTIIPDDLMLFQFSALSFNSHKIHLDRDYAQKVEGYPDLVVNGGLTTLLMTELARTKWGEDIRQLTVRNIAPLFANRPLHLARSVTDGNNTIYALNENSQPAAAMEFATNEF
jgi:3-methylfumaryl-CoA hydratase